MRTSRIAVDAGTAARIEALARMIHRPTADIVRTLSHATLDDFLRLHARRSVREQRGLRADAPEETSRTSSSQGR